MINLKKNIRLIISLIVMLLASTAVLASDLGSIKKERTRRFRLHYVINIAELDSAFEDNSVLMADMRNFLTKAAADSVMKITGVDFRGTASPDGTYEFNVWLSENRLRTFKEFVSNYITIPDSIIHLSVGIPWDEFRQAVVEGDVPMKERVLEIIDEEGKIIPWYLDRHIDSRLHKLKRLDGGRVWDVLRYPILSDLRYGSAIFYLDYTFPMPDLARIATVIDRPDAGSILRPALREEYTWLPRIYIKTNLVGWAATSANLSFEFDLAPHWSFALPIYYCGMDWIKSTIKFRNFSVQPEFRYWPAVMKKGANDGFFLGAHFGLNYFNFAFDGAYRYQDRRGRTPALGGGLALGYRFPISRNRRWHMEFSAGAGIYKTDYDVFHNTPNYKEGQWVRREKKTYYGLDQAAITFSYNFGLTRHERHYYKEGGKL